MTELETFSPPSADDGRGPEGAGPGSENRLSHTQGPTSRRPVPVPPRRDGEEGVGDLFQSSRSMAGV